MRSRLRQRLEGLLRSSPRPVRLERLTQPQVRSLESRFVLDASAVLIGAELTVTGDADAETLSLEVDQTTGAIQLFDVNREIVEIVDNPDGELNPLNPENVSSISINLGGGDDTLNLRLPSGIDVTVVGTTNDGYDTTHLGFSDDATRPSSQVQIQSEQILLDDSSSSIQIADDDVSLQGEVFAGAGGSSFKIDLGTGDLGIDGRFTLSGDVEVIGSGEFDLADAVLSATADDVSLSIDLTPTVVEGEAGLEARGNVSIGGSDDVAGHYLTNLQIHSAESVAISNSAVELSGELRVENVHGETNVDADVTADSVWLQGSGDITIRGAIDSQSGEVQVSSSGLVEVTTTGSIQSTSDVSLSGSQVELDGVIVARGAQVELDSGEIGTTLVRGRIDVSANQTIAGQTAGEVRLLGMHVGLFDQAIVDASAADRGGAILIGGDYQGGNVEVGNALRTFVGEGVTLRADATLDGDGGRVIVWGNEATRFYGSIFARGGADGGDGGFVEVSGQEYLDFQGVVNTLAPQGASGTLLLDPLDLTISNAPDAGIDPSNPFAPALSPARLSWASIKTALSGTSVVVSTVGSPPSGTETGLIQVTEASGDLATANDLTLQAAGAIQLDAAITNTGMGNLTLDAQGGDVTTLSTVDFAGSVNASGTNVTLVATDAIQLGAINALKLSVHANEITQDASGVSVTTTAEFTATTEILLNQDSNDFQGAVAAGGTDVTLTDATDIMLGDIDASGSLTVSSISGSIDDGAEVGIGDDVNVAGTTLLTASAMITLDDQTNDFEDQVSASAASIELADANSIAVGSIIADTTSGLVSIDAGGAITDQAGLATTNIVAKAVALRAVTGIGSADALETQVSDLAFQNTASGKVQIANTGALAITVVDGLESSSNTGDGITSMTASSPVTFAVDTTSVGTLTANATESLMAGDDVTVNTGVTVTSLAGDVVFNAGDNIVIEDVATVRSAAGDVTLNSGVADVDNLGQQNLNGSIQASVGTVRIDLGAVLGLASQSIDGSITASNLQLLSAADGSAFQLDQSANNDVQVLAANAHGTIAYRDANALQVGAVDSVGVTTSDDDVKLVSGGDLSINESIQLAAGDLFLAVTGNVTQSAPGTIMASGLGLMVDGTTTLELGNDVETLAASTGGTIFYNDVNGFTIG
ncbi:MAG: beta strand repeat-containing protein, partial [Rubripirellula sp.]